MPVGPSLVYQQVAGAHSYSSTLPLRPGPGQARSAIAPRATRPRAGRGSEKTSRRCGRLSVPITRSLCRESTRPKRARRLIRYTPAGRPACRSGNCRHHGSNAMGPSHGRVGHHASTRTHGGRPPIRSADSRPPGKCTAWPHPGSRCKPSPAPTVAAYSTMTSQTVCRFPRVIAMGRSTAVKP